ncbi:imidazole glycerol phosphate synthase subunit HisH [Planctomycetota bacterium]
MIAIVDYGMGNIRSLSNAVEFIGYEVMVTSDPQNIKDAAKIILPGVGAFGDAIARIREKGLDEILHREVIERGKPMLGICLGLQLLARSSCEHGFHKGLGWLEAEVVKFDPHFQIKIPHIGWNDIDYADPDPLFHALKEEERAFYFVHSFYVKCENAADILATCTHGLDFAAAIRRNNVVATQFHPEKSQDNGIQVLRNFLEWNP